MLGKPLWRKMIVAKIIGQPVVEAKASTAVKEPRVCVRTNYMMPLAFADGKFHTDVVARPMPPGKACHMRPRALRNLIASDAMPPPW